MKRALSDELDLMPPAFAEGLDDWSRGDGTPDTPTYERSGDARLAVGDADFGTCLEMRKVEPVQRLRYMGEVPIRRGGFVEIGARLKVMRGPLPLARIAAWPGGAQGRAVTSLSSAGPLRQFGGHGAVLGLSVVVGPDALPGVDLIWDARVLYAHVGLDLAGPDGGVVRIERIAVLDVTARFAPRGRALPGFEAAPIRRSRA